MTSGVPEAFGFVPRHIVADLQDVGNWKSRATAIDALHKYLKDVAKPATLVPSLADFVKFLADLVVDANFKIAISAMSILGDLATKVGSELQPYLRVAAISLLDKLVDSKILVRGANMKLIKRLMHACSPATVLAELAAAGASKPNCRVREELINVHIMAMLAFSRGSYDAAAVYRLLASGLEDAKEKVRLVALEGLAVLHSRLGGEELAALMAGGGGQQAGGGQPLAEALRAQVAARLANPALPVLNGDGLVEHAVELPSSDNPDIRLVDAAFGGAPGVKMSWGETATPPRPRMRSNPTADGLAPAVSRPAQPIAIPAPPAPGAASGLDLMARMGSDPVASGRREALLHMDGGRGTGGGGLPAAHPPMHMEGGRGTGGGGLPPTHPHVQQEDAGLLPPPHRSGSIQPLPPTTGRLGSHDLLSGGAPITAAPLLSATGWSSHNPHLQQQSASHPHPQPGSSSLHRGTSPLREVTMSGPGGLSLLGTENSQEHSGGGSGPGGLGHGSALQPLKHPWGASRSLDSQAAGAARGLQEGCEDSPLSPTRGYQPLFNHRHSGSTATGDPGRDSLDLLAPRPTSVRTQAAQELRESRGPPAHSHSHPPPQMPAFSSQQLHHHLPPQQQQQGLSGTQASTGLWLPSGLEQDSAVTRQETFSPSKAEMLARLKNRQIEKRAATAQQLDAGQGPASSDLASAPTDLPAPSLSFSVGQNARRYLVQQFSDGQREGASSRAEAANPRGYNSVLNTPTRAQGTPANPFDDGPPSTHGHRPARVGLAARLNRATPLNSDSALASGLGSGPGPGSAGAGPGQPPSAAIAIPTRSPTLPGSHSGTPGASEDYPARNPSPALNRLRARSAENTAANPGTPGGPGSGPGAGGGAGVSSGGGPGPTPATPGTAAGAYWEKGRGGDVGSEELTPLAEPEKVIKEVIAKLTKANHADRKELQWHEQYEALIDARRLVRHHHEHVKNYMHEFIRAAAPAIDQLRSQTAKCALMLFQECFCLLNPRVLERELDEIVPVLLKKAGEVSNAGRDNFLAAEADRVLAEMYRCCSESRSTTALLSCAGHKNPYVRGKVAFHLDNHLEACAGGGGGRQTLAGNTACIERLFKAAAAFLEEGSLDTRTHGKRIIWHVKGLMPSRAEFERLLACLTPESLHRKVVDVVEGLNGPPPPPSRGFAGAGATAGAGSRMASRQVGTGTGATPASPARPLLDQAAGSLTQPPPPVRQGSYSAPSPLHSGSATPERRRLGRQRTNDLDGIPESGGNSRTNSFNGRQPRLSAGAGAAGGGMGVGGGGLSSSGRLRHAASADGSTSSAGMPSSSTSSNGFGPMVQETVVKALQLLTAKDFRERIEAMRNVEGVVSALSGAPDGLLMTLLDALVARLGDGNTKVSMAALGLVANLAGSLRHRMSLGLNTLVPALAATLGSTNDKVRAEAVVAADSLLASLDPAMLVQHFSHCVGNGTLQRGKPILVEKLVQIVNGLYGTKPQLVTRYAVPAAFALLNDSRGGEAKAAANALLGALARLMGPALLEQATSLNGVAQQKVAEAVAAATGQVMSEWDRERSGTGDRHGGGGR
ncbi:hypothetical protein Agub_g3246 [Astrephomene gubernaculifera]|uniref:TOG domain-containing protein n=2 Tax=Astrephomene gubernaculifera TaxID=47775 RepID=A0AAD3DKL1_9CHLO|nr:hypothetical protein Agub_g3246 [Astrephomene gubernaculifera]